MEDFGTINPMQAIQDLGCYRLGARIWDLRHAGHPISRRMVSGKNRYGDSVSYAEYRLENRKLNHITIMGRLTRDPELRHTQTGTAVASFTLAVDRDFKDKATGDCTTDFIDVVAWRQTGELSAATSQKVAWPW